MVHDTISIRPDIDYSAPGYVNFTIDTSLCYLWQYDNAENLKTLMQDRDLFVKEQFTDFFTNFTKNIFSVKDANTFGLNLWGIIMGVKRVYRYNGTNYNLSDKLYRRVIIATATRHNMSGTLPDIYKYLQIIFPEKPFFVVDHRDMTVEITYNFMPTNEEKAVINSEGFFPIPAGVLLNNTTPVPSGNFFGFCTGGTAGESVIVPGGTYTGDYDVFFTGNTMHPGGIFMF